MRRLLQGRNRRLLFRSYLVLVGGLLTVAILLDFGFGYIERQGKSDTDRFLESTFHLVEARLAGVPAASREAIAADLSEEIGVNVSLLARDDVHVDAATEHRLVPLVDADGNTSYVHDAESIGAVLRLGPIEKPGNAVILDLLPPLFYLSIFATVGFWLRPLLRDIRVISSAAQRFAADYRKPLATADNTTELRMLARNLDDMSARLSGVLRSQKELIAALSHEMRTPLARLRFALAVTGDKEDEVLRMRLAAMNDDVQEIDDLIAAMLTYARLDHPDLEMRWQRVPAVPWLEKVIAKQNADEIRIDLDTANVPDTIRMDPRLMELALSNLLVNALKYGRRDIACTVVNEDGEHVLSVEDDGPGIPADAREKVFKAFSRIDDSRSRETGGYGLGLAVVARVAELHGGGAAVGTSAALGGARFRVGWPAA